MALILGGLPVTEESTRRTGGRLIVRLARKCQITGRDAFVWRENVPPPRDLGDEGYDPHEPMGHRGWSHHATPSETFHRAMASTHTSLLIPTDAKRDAIVAEARRIRDELRLPELASLLEERLQARKGEPAAASGLFAPGDVHAAVKGIRLFRIGLEEIRGYLSRHTFGDSGLHGGQWADLEPDEDSLYCPPLASVPLQNQVALDSGHGCVRSRFSLYDPARDDPQAHHSGSHNETRRPGSAQWLECTTLLCPGRPNMTFIHTNGDGTEV
jgi:hypothetical protein